MHFCNRTFKTSYEKLNKKKKLLFVSDLITRLWHDRLLTPHKIKKSSFNKIAFITATLCIILLYNPILFSCHTVSFKSCYPMLTAYGLSAVDDNPPEMVTRHIPDGKRR